MSSRLEEAKKLARLRQQQLLEEKVATLKGKKRSPQSGKKRKSSASSEAKKTVRRKTKSSPAKTSPKASGKRSRSLVEDAIAAARKKNKSKGTPAKSSATASVKGKSLVEEAIAAARKKSENVSTENKKSTRKTMSVSKKAERTRRKSSSRDPKVELSKPPKRVIKTYEEYDSSDHDEIYPKPLPESENVQVVDTPSPVKKYAPRSTLSRRRKLYTPTTKLFLDSKQEVESPLENVDTLSNADSDEAAVTDLKDESASQSNDKVSSEGNIPIQHLGEIDNSKAKIQLLLKRLRFLSLVFLFSFVIFIFGLYIADLVSLREQSLAIEGPELFALPSSASGMQVSTLVQSNGALDDFGLDAEAAAALREMFFKLSKTQQDQVLAQTLSDLNMVVYSMEQTNMLLKYGMTFVWICTMSGWFLGPILL
mmetsp:Transcript_16182/g.21266  ORF Transcript_16182/g.21266 Transcript_16182/m.21266 type:complete len:424 (+) Transcript_16182:280-1551(+)